MYKNLKEHLWRIVKIDLRDYRNHWIKQFKIPNWQFPTIILYEMLELWNYQTSKRMKYEKGISRDVIKTKHPNQPTN